MDILTPDRAPQQYEKLRQSQSSDKLYQLVNQKLRFIPLLAITTVILLTPFSKTHARELEGRLGVGYNSEFANAYPASAAAGGFRFPGISLKYGLTRDLAVAGIFGIATTSPSNMLAAFKFFKNIFFENHLNFYFTLGGGLLSVNNQSGFQGLAAVGVEFFIPGIESLGLSVETGASVDTASGFAIKTLGVSFLDAGIHFYF